MLRTVHVLAATLAVLSLTRPGTAVAEPDLDEPVPGMDEPIPSPTPTPASPSVGDSNITITKGGEEAGASAGAGTSAAGAVGDSNITITKGGEGQAGRGSLLRPTVKLGYRTFATPDDDLARDQPWNVATFTVYPWSNHLRIGLVTELGVETAAPGRSREDFFIQEGLVMGYAHPGPRFTPFVEGTLGGGFMRRLATVSMRVAPGYGLLWTVGGEAGVEVRMVRGVCASFALGLLHPTEVRYSPDLATASLNSSVHQSTVLTLTAGIGF